MNDHVLVITCYSFQLSRKLKTCPWTNGIFPETRAHPQKDEPWHRELEFKEKPWSGKRQLDLSFSSRLGSIWPCEAWVWKVDFGDWKQAKKSKKRAFLSPGIRKGKVFRKLPMHFRPYHLHGIPCWLPFTSSQYSSGNCWEPSDLEI